jgi:hypothetical protein
VKFMTTEAILGDPPLDSSGLCGAGALGYWVSLGSGFSSCLVEPCKVTEATAGIVLLHPLWFGCMDRYNLANPGKTFFPSDLVRQCARCETRLVGPTATVPCDAGGPREGEAFLSSPADKECADVDGEGCPKACSVDSAPCGGPGQVCNGSCLDVDDKCMPYPNFACSVD